SVVGDEIVGHAQTAAVGFIGSTETGLTIARRAAGKRLLLEMGGNGPLVVLDDADLDAAAEAAVSGCFLCAGQSCTAGERLLVHRAVRQELIEKIAQRTAEQVRLGDPFDPQTTLGPLNNEGVAATKDLSKGLRYADEARTGLVNINETTNYWENHLPFGGRAGTASGVGRVGGRYAMETLTELQTVVIG